MIGQEPYVPRLWIRVKYSNRANYRIVLGEGLGVPGCFSIYDISNRRLCHRINNMFDWGLYRLYMAQGLLRT